MTSSLFSLFISLFLLPHIVVNAFDITQILSQYPEFSTFSSYLTQANLVTEINSRQTITLLVVDNANMSPLSGKPVETLANVLSVHVVLDYFDVPKLQMLPEAPTTLTTLFQATGRARGQQGFLNVTRAGTDGIAFSSPVAGSPPASTLVKSVFTQAYNVSVLQISHVILPPRPAAPAQAPPAPPAAVPPAAATPAASETRTPPVSAPSGGAQAAPAVAPIAVPPTTSVASTPSSSKAPLQPGAETPTEAVDPSEGSASSPGVSEEAPTAAAEAPATVETPAIDALPAAAAGETGRVGLAVICAGAVSTLFLAMRA